VLFNSYVFLFAFLPIVLLGWWVVFRRDVPRLVFLTLASYVFYAYHEFPRGLELLPLLLLSTNADFIAGRMIHRSDDQRVRRRWLIGALSINLGMLLVFKYLGFFAETTNALLGLLGHPDTVPVTHLALPIGISFYTFNSMSYTIDIYRRKVEPARSFIHYAAFVALFPHLVAGPIIRYSDLDVQLRNLVKRLTPHMASVGLFFIACGLFKKLLVADNLAPTVDRLYAAHDELSMLAAWVAAIAYSLQLYFDFSGYSDIAVGLALLLGFQFPQNFASPLKAHNVVDFWRRWHITLARWMRDYLFFSLGGSRIGGWRAIRNVLITFTLVGFWHGAAWPPLVWGLWQGVWIVLYNQWTARGWRTPPVWISRAGTYLVAVVALAIFRSPDMGVAADIYAGLFGFHGIDVDVVAGAASGAAVSLWAMAGIAAVLVFVNVAPNTWEFQLRPAKWMAVVTGVALAASILVLSEPSPFLYFDF